MAPGPCHWVPDDSELSCRNCNLPYRHPCHGERTRPERIVADTPVKSNGTATSAAAGKVAQVKRGTLTWDLLRVMEARGAHGATDMELESLTGKEHQSVSAARNRLVEMGWLVRAIDAKNGTPVTRPNARGNQATVWVFTSDGASAYKVFAA